MMAISNWPPNERPRERLKDKGAIALSDAELLALLLGTGSSNENVVEFARRILSNHGGLEKLASSGLGALSQTRGVGIAKASRILAALELGLRVFERRLNNRSQTAFLCSEDIFKTYQTRMGDLRQEVFMSVGLNNKNEPIHEVEVARGTVSECLVNPREVFRPMISEAAARIVVLHNHPSGDSQPSKHDLAITRRLARAGDLLGIPLLDHVIIGANSYSSLRDLQLISTQTSDFLEPIIGTDSI